MKAESAAVSECLEAQHATHKLPLLEEENKAVGAAGPEKELENQMVLVPIFLRTMFNIQAWDLIIFLRFYYAENQQAIHNVLIVDIYL